jgi:hypothetical protein
VFTKLLPASCTILQEDFKRPATAQLVSIGIGLSYNSTVVPILRRNARHVDLTTYSPTSRFHVARGLCIGVRRRAFDKPESASAKESIDSLSLPGQHLRLHVGRPVLEELLLPQQPRETRLGKEARGNTTDICTGRR